jgi:hypothetical protein
MHKVTDVVLGYALRLAVIFFGGGLAAGRVGLQLPLSEGGRPSAAACARAERYAVASRP